ncbi:UDP-glycosyltransferase UGT4 [Lucilia cuprina]|uniref:UDP-glycosyltransferase UGT4 n=1 Tax=Lucilia cuprina TaxID=7375 RepID=UPI001F057C74|nr:UDP-glycosyltransferase UGT4 [Lucilia cuprina]
MQQHKFHLIIHQLLLKWLLIATILMGSTKGAKILGIFPHASESHFVVMRTFMMELAKKEHNVTLYSSHRLDDRLDNLKENIIEPEFPFWKEVQKQAGVKDLPALSAINNDKLNNHLAAAGHSLMDYFLSNGKMQELLKTPVDDFDYDMIIVDLFYSEALLALGHYFSVPVIGVVNADFANYMEQIQDVMIPSACLPYDLKNYDRNLGYWQRLANIKSCLARRESFVYDHYGRQEKVIKKHFKASIPSIMDLQSNLALLLVNNYYPLATPKPLIPNIIPVGGLHIRAPKELPWHIRRFLDEARFGAIYMHLGDEKLCADIPKEKLDVLFHVLGKRQECILWTCHDVQKIEGLPKNMMIQHLVPQTDILAHPHIRLFIMNGDIMGLQESIIRHVPLLGLPLFENEMENIMLAEKLQIGVRVDYTNLTESSLDWALETILHKEFYVLNIRDISKIFRDRPLGGLANAIFWLDYIDRYGNGPLKTQALGMPLNELHLADLRFYSYLRSLVVLGVLIGLYYVGMFLWKKRQTDKMFSKLN